MSNSDIKLKPCPFCGSEAHIEEHKMVRVWYEVRCDNCDAGTGIWKTPDEAIKAWNVRSSHVKEGKDLITNMKKTDNGNLFINIEEIKPCPFCGSRFIEKATLTKGGKAQAFVACSHIDCHAKTGSYRNVKEAIAAWNRRA